MKKRRAIDLVGKYVGLGERPVEVRREEPILQPKQATDSPEQEVTDEHPQLKVWTITDYLESHP